MKTIFCILGVFIACAVAAKASEIDLAAGAIAGHEASFTQRFTPKGFKTPQVESGSVIFGKLPMMRWTYAVPEEKQFVFDGTQSWFYVPADKQVTVIRIDEARKRDLPFVLLGDSAARDHSFSVQEERQAGKVVTILHSREPNALIRDITVTITAADHLITRVDYSDREGNHTSFDFTGYHPRSAAPELFRFTPPAGTEVVNAQ